MNIYSHSSSISCAPGTRPESSTDRPTCSGIELHRQEWARQAGPLAPRASVAIYSENACRRTSVRECGAKILSWTHTSNFSISLKVNGSRWYCFSISNIVEVEIVKRKRLFTSIVGIHSEKKAALMWFMGIESHHKEANKSEVSQDANIALCNFPKSDQFLPKTR